MLDTISITGPEMLIMLAIFFIAVYVVKKIFSWVFTLAIMAIIAVGAVSFLAMSPQFNEPYYTVGQSYVPDRAVDVVSI